ncbi:hypothetical protein K435DRAFT_974669 [Dendrothele bispora CBS 962.96]|uniref:F-box domain-containing protein n=1 Tax=Dendrothele bispora (strain CBS 962.96) TaxID=1314807 RepID=A0A4S8KK43_DENBC|nr:hypothetical protein K435DRAFT_974669 [Dendrothele bispora CBS 962.96]
MILVTILYLLTNVAFFAAVPKDTILNSNRLLAAEFFGIMIKAWIERSGLTCPLFVRIDWYEADVREWKLPAAGNDAGLKLLVSQSHRWVTADVHVPGPTFCETLASTSGFPQLKRLFVLPLVQTSLPRFAGGRRTGLVFTDLTSILSRGHQLTHLSVAVAFPEPTSESDWCQALFDAVPLLESLHFFDRQNRTNDVFPSFPTSSSCSRHSSPRLQNLTLDFEVMNLTLDLEVMNLLDFEETDLSDHFNCLLDGLTLPRLNKLSLTAYAWGTSSVISSFFMRHPSLEFVVLRKSCTPHELRDHRILLKEEYPYVSLTRVGLGSDSRYHHHYAGEPVTLDLHDWIIHRRRLGQNRRYEETRVEKIRLQENSKEIRQISMPLLMQPKETDRVTLPPGANWAIISQGNHPLEFLPLSSNSG